MPAVRATIVIQKPLQEVFEYTASPHNGPVFIPNLNENSNITPEAPSVGQTFDWRFNLAGVDLTGKGVVTGYEPPYKATITTTGDTNTAWVYTFQTEGSGTRVTAEVEYEINESVLKKIANRLVIDKINQHSAEQMLENLKTILEG